MKYFIKPGYINSIYSELDTSNAAIITGTIDQYDRDPESWRKNVGLVEIKPTIRDFIRANKIACAVSMVQKIYHVGIVNAYRHVRELDTYEEDDMN